MMEVQVQHQNLCLGEERKLVSGSIRLRLALIDLLSAIRLVLLPMVFSRNMVVITM